MPETRSQLWRSREQPSSIPLSRQGTGGRFPLSTQRPSRVGLIRGGSTPCTPIRDACRSSSHPPCVRRSDCRLSPGESFRPVLPVPFTLRVVGGIPSGPGCVGGVIAVLVVRLVGTHCVG